MKKPQILFMTAILLTIVLYIGISIFPLIGCNGESCCPEIISFTAKPRIVCPIDCNDDGGKTYLKAKVLYHRGGKEYCTPTSGTKITITDKSNNTPLITNVSIQKVSGTDYYEDDRTIKDLTGNTIYQLEAFGEPGCPAMTKDTDEVIVIQKNYSYYLCTAHGDLSQQCTWDLKGDIFGKGVVIDSIMNPSQNIYTVTINYQGKKVTLKPGARSNAHQGMTPDQNWNMSITNSEQCAKFANNPRDFCIKVELVCECVR
jgi:hypothetical protein